MKNYLLSGESRNCTFMRTVKRRAVILVFALLASTQLLLAQQITGVVTDADSQALPGVNIVIKGTTNGTVTDFDGKYSIAAKAGDILVFQFIGYNAKDVTVADSKVINVALDLNTSTLDEVVVVGYGSVKKSLVTGAISSVKAEDLENSGNSRIEQAMQGRTAGVTVTSTSGSPGAGAKVRIRGTGSNSSSEPLYIVDGMKTGGIDNIDPNDIASMEILKDAASSAIYGTEGANGVVIITTKKGKKGEGKIDYSFQYGSQSARTGLKLMDASQYKTWMGESGSAITTNSTVNTNWLDEVFQNAPMTKHHISFTGGSEKSSYMMSASYLNQDGIVGGSKANFKRYTLRLNSTHQLKDWLEVGNSLTYSNITRAGIQEDDEYRGIVNNALLLDPLTPVKYAQGTTPARVQDILNAGNTALNDGNGSYYGLPEYATGEIGNPVALLETFKGDTKQDKLLGTFYAKISPFKGFEFTSRLGIDMAYQNQHSWAPKYFISAERNNAVNTIDDNNNKWYTWLLENFATYHNVIGDHDFTLLAGYSAQSYKNNYYYLHSGPMVKEGDIYADHSSTTSRSSDRVAGTTTESTMASVFGRLSYSFKNKYMFEASFRNDGASEFPTEQKYGFFPAFSAGWVVSEESFGKIPGMDYMKIRASWGQNGSKSNLVGNEDKELWTFGGIQYPKNGGGYYPGSEINTLPNDKLVWERSEQTDFGVDLKFFNSSLSVSADYFNKLTKDLIINGTGPLSVGQDLPRINGGTVSNKGFEIELGYRGEVGELGYAVNMNMSFLKNEVTDMSVKTPIKGDNLRGYDLTWFSMNQPIWYFKGYKVSGIDPKTGDPIVVDTDGKPGISDADQTYIGDPHPDMIFGANVQLDYKGFDFSMFLQGTQGNDVFMGWFRSDRATSNKPAFFFEDRWTPTNTNASMPKANNTSDYIYRSSLMVQDGSYIRIKQIQLGYTLPKDLLTKFKISTVRAYVSLEDYFTFTKYQGLDPEAGSSNNQRQGVDRGLYPIAGKLMFGLNLSF